MSKFYCNVCDEEVKLEDGKCPKCNTDWEKISNESVNNEEGPVDVYSKKVNVDEELFKEEKKEKIEDLINDEDINDNIRFFIKWAGIVKVFMIIVAIIIAILAFIGIEDTDGYSLFSLIGSACIIILAIILDNNLKWKAYMLYTNKKTKK